jgi:manganese/zinc/iron transport system permease protein
VLAIGATAVLCKEFRLLCFDEAYAASIGRSVPMLDVLLMLVSLIVIVIGLQAVGLILVIALLIVPASAARFWTDGFVPSLIVAGLIGALSGWFGSTLSALESKLPAGAVIVLVAGVFFLFSLFAGTRRGLLRRLIRSMALRRRVHRQHVLRDLHEAMNDGEYVAFHELQSRRRWRTRRLKRALRRAMGRGETEHDGNDGWTLTQVGRQAAEHVVRNHRLWEMFLIHYADIAPSHVDRDADMVEHVLDAELVAELERLLDVPTSMPSSPHSLGGES